MGWYYTEVINKRNHYLIYILEGAEGINTWGMDACGAVIHMYISAFLYRTFDYRV